MPTPVSYLSGASLSNTVGMFKRGTIAQNLKTSLESGYRWWNGVEVTSSQYLIYSDTFTLGTTTQANATPVAYSTPDLTDQSLLNLINTLPPRIGQTAFTSLPIALQWLQSSNKFFLIRGGTENIVKSGLQLYADAGRFDSYIGNGTTWSDLSSNGNNGTLVNDTGYNSSGVGSMVFDGTNDYVNFGNAASLQITSALTVDVWLKADTTTDFTTAVAKSNGATGGWTVQLRDLVDEWRFWVNFGVNTLGNGSNNGWYYANFPKTWNDGKWHHFVGIWDGSSKTVKIYIDGIQGTFNAGGNPNGESSNIGNYNGNLVAGAESNVGNPFDGNISSLKVYNIAFSPEQVLQNFNAQKYRFGYYDYVQDGLVLNLDASNYISYPRSGTTWTDLTGRGNNGTLTNGPTFSGGTTPSIVFDGSDDYVNLTTATTLGINNVSTSFTISTWFKVAVVGEYYLLDNYNGSTQDISFRIDSGKFEVYLMASAGGGFNAVQFGGGYSNGIWTNFTLIWNGSDTIIAYANGINIGSSTKFGMTGNFDSGTAFQIGARPFASTYFPGNISIIQIYNRALSPQEIIQNFESQRVYYGVTGITTNGLVLNLDAANNASYNGSGTTWVDISGNEFDGTLINGPTYGNSGATSNISLDGIDDFISGNTLTNLMNGSTTLTLIIWIYPTNLNNTDAGGSGYKTLVDTPNRHLSLWLGTQGKGQYYGIGGSTGRYTTNFNWENNKWQMVTIIANSSDGQIIKNNYDVSQTVGKGNTFTQQITFGNNPSTGGSNLEGRYGGIQLYNRALSVAEVSQNYNAQKSRFGL
jgi:hypothetical protein